MTCFGFSFLFLIFSLSLIHFIAGIRQLLYLYYIYGGYILIKDNIYYNTYKFLSLIKFIIITEIIYIIFQILFMIQGEGMGLFYKKCLGSFNNPNTLGVLGGLCAIILVFYNLTWVVQLDPVF